MMIDLKDRFLGAIFGLAVGDALGDQVQFLPRDTFPLVTEMVGGGHHRNAPGDWTDDTSMALCLAKSLLTDGFDLPSQMKYYSEWLTDGKFSSKNFAFDVGRSTHESIANWMYGRCDDGMCGSPDPLKAGNGAIIRIAPIPMYYHNSKWPTMAEFAAQSSMTTHGTLETQDGCRLLSILIYRALHGEVDILNPIMIGFKHELIASINKGEYKKKDRNEISSHARTADTLEAGLWCFHNSSDFESGLILAVNLGWDADSVGAVYGQLAGAYYGYSAIPQKWIKKIAKPKTLRSCAEQLFEHTKE